MDRVPGQQAPRKLPHHRRAEQGNGAHGRWQSGQK
jgi:hypothetical protein